MLNTDGPSKRGQNRKRALCFLLACLLIPGCVPLWKSIPTDQRSVDKAELVGKIVKITDPNGYFHKFMVHEINYPYLITNGMDPRESRYEVSVEKAIGLQYQTRVPERDRIGKAEKTVIFIAAIGLVIGAFALWINDMKKNGVALGGWEP